MEEKPIYLIDNLSMVRSVWDKSQDEMARLFGMTRVNYQAVESGRRKDFYADFLLRFEELTGVAARRLYYEKLLKTEIYHRPYVNENGVKILIEDNDKYKTSHQLYSELRLRVDAIESALNEFNIKSKNLI